MYENLKLKLKKNVESEDKKMVIIALDVGGTKIKGALIRQDLSIIKSLKIPTMSDKGRVVVLKNMHLVIDSLLDTKEKITSIGISFPGFSNDKGQILFAGNALKEFVGYNLKTSLEKKYSLPVVVENDANCFTLAESYAGAGKSANIVLGVVWGSGIGAGLVIKKQHSIHRIQGQEHDHTILYQGSFDGALELGHIPLLMVDGKTKTLEELIGGKFLTKKYKVADVTELYKKDKKIIKEVFKRFAQGLAIAITITNPDVVVIGGGVSNIPQSAFNEILSLTKKYALPTHTKNLSIKKYAISDDAGLLGIAIIALKIKL